MANYRVWVSSAEGGGRVELLDTDDGSAVSSLIGTLVGASGTTSYDLGISIMRGDPTPPSTPPTSTVAAKPAGPAPAPAPTSVAQGGRR